jgi:hypothetical protein
MSSHYKWPKVRAKGTKIELPLRVTVIVVLTKVVISECQDIILYVIPPYTVNAKSQGSEWACCSSNV